LILITCRTTGAGKDKGKLAKNRPQQTDPEKRGEGACID